MRGSLIRSLIYPLLCGTSVLALPHARANGQVEQAETNISTPVSSAFAPDAVLNRDLPESPGTVLRRRMQAAGRDTASGSSSLAEQIAGPAPRQSETSEAAAARASDRIIPAGCPAVSRPAGSGTGKAKAGANPASGSVSSAASASASAPPASACAASGNPYQRFLNSTTPIPLTTKQKAYLAVHNFIDPGNIVTVLGTSGIAIATDSHTAYGPGWRGFGRSGGTSFVEDATGDFFGTFLVPALAHEDPHYHRLPNASIPMRTLHAISRTVIAQSDTGRAMPNYSTLLTYPITAEIANLYVPGVATNGPSTVERILTGYATDPIDNLITEFLPDVAKRIHVRVIFVQQIINQVAAGQTVDVFP